LPYLKTRKNLKLQLSAGLVASYDIQPCRNGVGLFWDTTHTRDPHGRTQPSYGFMGARRHGKGGTWSPGNIV